VSEEPATTFVLKAEAVSFFETLVATDILFKTYLRFDILTAVVMKSSTFWDIMQCNPLKSTDVSEEHVASIISVEEKAKRKICMKQFCMLPVSGWFLAWLIIRA
jgi:hypothetical protein